MSEARVIGGVRYLPVRDPTLRHDNWLLGRVRGAGLVDVTIRDGEAPEDWARRFMFELMARDEAMLLVGGVLVPEGVAWSPKVAAQTAERLGDIKDPDEKEWVVSLLLQVLVRFFETGLTSAWTTRTS